MDVLACPRCGNRLRLVATVEDPAAVRQCLATRRPPETLVLAHRPGRSPTPDDRADCFPETQDVPNPPVGTGLSGHAVPGF